jgi:hypothetical protein
MGTVAKVACVCSHEQQDKMYGNGVRVANLTQKGTGNSTTRYVRCTVCSKEHVVTENRLSK